MASIEAFHSSRGGYDFLGLRQVKGEVQIVYDDGVARRMVWRVVTPGASLAILGDALRTAVDHLRVVPTLLDELRRRAIEVETLRR